MKRNTKGFTLIELLIVVVIIGILAAIAIPKFAATKEKAYLATMKTDLKNVATSEEGYASSNSGSYIVPSDTTALSYQPSAGNSVTGAIITTPSAGWNAKITSNKTAKACYIFVGGGQTSNGIATVEGAPACDP